MNYFVEGLQGSGKSTLVRKIGEAHPDYTPVMEGDYSPVELAWCAYVDAETYRGILEKYGGTGIQKCLEDAVYKTLDYIPVYPVEDESKLCDHFGRVLPDCHLVPRGSTARDLAYRIHTDLGDKFIRAVNCRNHRTVGADYVLEPGDIIRIVANK